MEPDLEQLIQHAHDNGYEPTFRFSYRRLCQVDLIRPNGLYASGYGNTFVEAMNNALMEVVRLFG